MNQIYIRGNELITAEQFQVYLNNYLTSLSGYNAEETQVLKNINGELTWVTEVAE